MSRRRGAGALSVGQIVRARPGVDPPFAPNGQLITIRELLDGERVRIAYGDVTDLIVPASTLDLHRPGARATDPAASHLAAASQTPVKLSAAKRLILGLLAEAGERGLNDFELEARTGRKQTSFGKRRGELRDIGLVADTGLKRPSDTSTDATVWAITPLGIDVWRDLHQGAA